MRVKALVSFGGLDGDRFISPAPGSIIELTDDFAQHLIDIGQVEAVKEDTVEDPQGEPTPAPKAKKKA